MRQTLQIESIQLIFYETYDSFLKKFQYYPKGFLGKLCKDKLIGYVVGHPWKGDDVVPLNFSSFENIRNPDCFYIYDIVVDEKYRGKNYSRKLLSTIIDVGEEEGFRKFMCVAVSSEGRKLAKLFYFNEVEEIQYTNNIKGWKMVRGIK